MIESDPISNRMLAVITVLLVIAGLRASYAVTMPLAAAIVIIAVIWPIKPWLDKALPSKISYMGPVLILTLAFVAFTGALYFSAAQAVSAFSEKQEQFNRVYKSVTDWAAHWGVQGFGFQLGNEETYGRLIKAGQMLLANAYTVFVYLGFIAILVIFGLLEAPVLRTKVRAMLNAADRGSLIDAVDEIASKTRQYFCVILLTSAITGLISALWSYATGLELAVVWGTLNFLLNFIPVIGNIVGIFPPVLYAVIQFQNVTMPLIVFVGFVVLQTAISYIVTPVLQGRSVALSPLATIVALAFWSWLWGIAGALIAVPLTAALVVIFEQFGNTQWVGRLLSRKKEDG